MKKILHIFLLTIYLPAALGVGFNVHYCRGEIKSVDVFSYSGNGCMCHDNDNGCCDNDWKYVKLDDNSQRTQPVLSFNFSPVMAFVQPVFHSNLFQIVSGQTIGITFSHGPPLIYDSPVYLRFRSILI